MKLHQLSFLILLIILPGCQTKTNEASLEKWKQEIVDTESAFAADDAVLMRNNSLVIGKQEMTKFFETQSPGQGKMSLSWKPDYVDVSKSGDLGYTYGKFVLTLTDTTGVTRENTGVFHTVWKKQADGSWRFVWD